LKSAESLSGEQDEDSDDGLTFQIDSREDRKERTNRQLPVAGRQEIESSKPEVETEAEKAERENESTEPTERESDQPQTKLEAEEPETVIETEETETEMETNKPEMETETPVVELPRSDSKGKKAELPVADSVIGENPEPEAKKTRADRSKPETGNPELEAVREGFKVSNISMTDPSSKTEEQFECEVTNGQRPVFFLTHTVELCVKVF
jgi:hypothetical protein